MESDKPELDELRRIVKAQGRQLAQLEVQLQQLAVLIAEERRATDPQTRRKGPIHGLHRHC